MSMHTLATAIEIAIDDLAAILPARPRTTVSVAPDDTKALDVRLWTISADANTQKAYACRITIEEGNRPSKAELFQQICQIVQAYEASPWEPTQLMKAVGTVASFRIKPA